MTRFFVFMSALFALMLVHPALGQDEPAKPRIRAVVIGVSGYTQDGVPPLIGAYNDAMLVSDTLVRNGAKKEDIVLLVDRPSDVLLKAAGDPNMRSSQIAASGVGTRENILGALKKLVERTERGDEVVISFSGHGFQQADDEPGEEPDGLDEIFLPFDIAPSVDGKVFGKAITDDEIGAVIDAIRAKGGNVLYIGDFCHSGDSNRGDGPTVLPSTEALGIRIERNFSTVDDGNFKRDLAVETKQGTGWGSYVGLLAAPADTQAKQYSAPSFASRENKSPHGILTAYAMLNLSNKRVVTYRDLASRVNSNIDAHRGAPRPLFDGDLDRPVLGGAVRVAAGVGDSWTVDKPYIKTEKSSDPVGIETLELAAGELSGLAKDAIIGLSLVGEEGEKTILYGRVESVDAYKAKLVPASFGDIAASQWEDVRDLDGRPLKRPAKLIATVAQQPVDLDFAIAMPTLPKGASATQKATVAALGEMKPADVGATFVSAGSDADLVLVFDGDRLAIEEPAGAPTTDFGELDIATATADDNAARALRFRIGQALVRASKFHRLRRVLAGIGLEQDGEDDPARQLSVEFFVARPKMASATAACPDTDAAFYAVAADAKPLAQMGQRDSENFELRRCDWMFVKITNTGLRELYVNPLIFSPDGSIFLVQPKAANPTRFAPNESGVVQYQLTDTRPDGLLRDDFVVLVSEATDGTAVSFAKLEQCPVVPGPEDEADCQSASSLSATKMRGAGEPGSAIEELIDSALNGSQTRGGTSSRPAKTSALRYSWQTRE